VTDQKLDPRRTSLLIFDMLNVHVRGGGPDILDLYRPVVANVQRLLAAARIAGLMVAFATANHRSDGGTSALPVTDTDNRLQPWTDANRPSRKPVVAGGTWEAQVIDELAPSPEDYVIPKYRWSAFHQTYLDLALRNRGVDTILLCGGATDIGIASTAFTARDLDYNLVVVSDGCTSSEMDSHDQLMRRVFPRMSRVRTTDQVLQMLPG
jgi:nicotinamidase-related amidase